MPKDVAHDDESQYVADDLPGPGDENPRHEAEEDAVDGDELDRRQTGHIGQHDEQDHDKDGYAAKGRDIIGQSRNIMLQRQLSQGAVKRRHKPMNGQTDADQQYQGQRLHQIGNHRSIHNRFHFP